MKNLFYLIICLFLFGHSYATEWEHIISPDTVKTTACFIDDNGDAYLGSSGIYKMNLETGEFSYLNEFDFENKYKDDNFSDNYRKCNAIYKTSGGTLLSNFYGQFGIYYSTNGGLKWSNVVIEEKNYASGITLFYEYKGKVYTKGSTLLVSEDDGKSWDVLDIEQSSYSINNLIYFDKTSGKILLLATNKESQKKVLLEYDLNTQESTIIEIKIDDLEKGSKIYFTKDNKYYVSDLNKIWSSSDQGDTWSEYVSLDNITDDSEEKILWLTYSENNFLFLNTNLTKKLEGNAVIRTYHTYFSTDYGQTWKRSKYMTYSQIGTARTFTHNKTDYILANCLYQYDTTEQDFVPAKYQFPGKGKYYKFDNKEVYNGVYQNFERLSSEEWALVNHNKKYRFDGSYYQLVDGVLQFVSVDGSVTDIRSAMFYKVKLSNIGHDIITYYPTFTSNKRTLIVKDGNILSEFEEISEFSDVLDVGLYYSHYLKADRSYDKTPLQVEKTNLETKETNTITLPSDINPVTYFAWKDEKAILANGNGIYLSTNNGKDWTDMWNNMPELKRWGFGVEIFNNHFYIFGSLGILKSSDGETWQNILEGATTAFVYDIEMDYQGRIYANTLEGHFISKEPISVEESKESTKEMNISLFPNPASDILQFSFDSNIESISLIDLNGNSFNTERNGNQIDISNLSSGTYFLKIKSEGKAYLKQFVVTR